MKTRLSLALAFLLVMVQSLWAQTSMTPAGENTWTAPMPAYQILLHAEYWGEYAISYELNGGINHEENPVKYYEDQEITLKQPTKEGYVFSGWTGSNGETPQTEVTIAQGSTGNKSYTANWTALKACELGWMNVPEGGVVGTIGHEDEIVLPQVNASLDFISAFQAHTATLRLGSTDESVLKVFGFNNFQVIGVGECDVYVVHDEDAVFAYDSAAFHVTVNPEPTYLDADFAINFMSDSYTVAEGTLPAGTVIDGTPNTGQTAHGYQNVVATVPVKAGKYRLTLGTCQYGTGTGNVMSETNIELASFDQKTAACYHQNPAQNTVSVIFDVDQDQHITIDCGQYTPYMKLEAVTAYQVSFALSDAEGTAPTAVDVAVGENITMPVNKTMYKEGYTLTGWSDGVNTYPIGESFTPANDVVLTPVFTANEADLLNASSEVTVKWYFGGDNGAPTTSYEGTSGLLVAQAAIGDKKVDVKLAIDATSGKFAPQATTEWAQVNVGTIFTYPYKEGMTVNVDNYKSKVTYYIEDEEGKVTCGENDYYSFIQVTYPASTPGPATAIDNANANANAVKVIRNGQLLIIRDGKTYNAQGAVVR